eukprot:NODE_17517_length_190_cov_7.170213_g16603_i0.p1 GENE.NODE_17517_length_190_cov_7.170213_g16603_i0~~NODE_17517_length_190_cov_7.170213_g16603_i0.p1  ORF type:complete len:59 (-),score=15.59 NODE_17517_length_190_cov_7.170213_g16603_i0:13-159(-)
MGDGSLMLSGEHGVSGSGDDDTMYESVESTQQRRQMVSSTTSYTTSTK